MSGIARLSAVLGMIHHTSSPKTVRSVEAAMEMARATGDMEVAERLFEVYRALFADYQAHKLTDSTLIEA
jgi:hypothetical protein